MGAVENTTARDQFNYVRIRRCTIAVCALLLITFVTLAGSAATGKSPTVDEPYHALSGWLQLWQSDYRIVCDHPPLWSMLAAVATRPDSLRVDLARLDQIHLPMDTGQETWWIVQTLFQTPGNDGVALIGRFRVVMLAIAAGMGAFLAAFVWRLSRAAGATPAAAGAASIFSTGLLAFDPNFLANSPLVKDDVVSALALLGLIASTWAAGRALTSRRVMALAIWSGFAMTVKLNAPLLISLATAMLVLRAVLPWPWHTKVLMGSRTLDSRLGRFGAATATVTFMAVVTFAMIWMSYRMRFAPSREAGATMDVPAVINSCMDRQWRAQHAAIATTGPSEQELAAMPTPFVVRFCACANERHVLPQAFLAGILYVFQSVQQRATFLCGHANDFGTWWYFPFAIAVKTPIATLVAVAIMGGVWRFRRKLATVAAGEPAAVAPSLCMTGRWTDLCLSMPVAIYLAAAMASGVDLGVRHVLPIYPLLFAMAGLGIAWLWDRRRAAALSIGSLVLIALTIESCCAYPNYLPFFNLFAGGSRGGLRLLSDSNLDWGQDLPLLAAWQKSNPNEKLYLAYFGSVDPAVYGIRYINIADGYLFGPPPQPIDSTGVVAISATTLQGTYGSRVSDLPTWSALWKLKPFKVLGGSIYLFHVPPTRGDYLPFGQSLIN